jgi:phosphatidyl-myo-inositol alpha-mannosyltransferase
MLIPHLSKPGSLSCISEGRVKIAQVTPYDISHPGGVGQHINHLRREFKHLGHEVVVMAPRAEKGGLEFGDDYVGIGRTVTIPGNGSKVRLTFDVTLYNAVKELMQREQFDVVHLHEPMTPVLPYMVLLNSKSVNIGTFHAARVTNPWYGAFKPYFAFLLSRLQGKICVSEPARAHMVQYFGGNYDIIPNGIDIDRYSDQIEPFPWASDAHPRILFVGRFNETRKGFKYVLRALPMIQQQFPRARLVVVGPGDRWKFEDQIERYQIRGVDFVGEVSDQDLPRYYASCDVFCAPSIHGESFGLVLLEAMASFKPVVASRIPGYASVVTHERDGLLVEPKDATAVALAIVRILADDGLQQRLSHQGRETAEHYAWPRVAKRVLDLYQASAELMPTVGVSRQWS